MSWIDDQITEQFWTWEALGRGVLTFPDPVSPSPPFVPFTGYRLPQMRDDGRRPGLLERMSRAIRDEPPPLPENEDVEPEPNWRGGKEYVELQVLLPDSFKADGEAFARFLANMAICSDPLAFEIAGASGRVVCQIAASVDDASAVRRQLEAHFPDASFVPTDGALASAWLDDEEAHSLVIELALSREFMFPLARSKSDPFVGLVGALSDLGDGEAGAYQVIFEPLAEPWADSAFAAVADAEGKPVFSNRPELVRATEQKVSQPLYGAVVRLAARSPDFRRSCEIAHGMASALRVFSGQSGNELFPLGNGNYPNEAHERDLLTRQTRRSGMILNADELMGFVHFPSAAVRSPVFARFSANTRPASIERRDGVFLGFNEHAGETSEVWLDTQSRLRHCHIIGGTGTGKSTLMLSMIAQDIERGEGFAVLDPHGDLIDAVLGLIPPERAGDVVLLDPSDEQFVVPFNIISAHSDFEKQLLASDLVSVFQRLSTSWGDQMQVVMQNAVLAFLESSEGGTLADLRRFLIDAAWRERFLQTVADPDVRFYWRSAFPQLGGGRSIGPILTRLETFLSPKPIRYMVSQRENRLDFDAMMDSRKIFLAKLPQGVIGRENAFLLGSLIMTKLQQAAMGRARMSATERVPFHCYIDEFQHFITPSLTEILSGSRKYSFSVALGHQELRQLDRDKDVASAVLSNAFTRIVFRVSDSDARTLAEGFAHFEARHLQSLGTGEAVCRIGSAGNDFNLSVPLPPEIDDDEAAANRAAVIEASRAAYAIPRSEIEAEMLLRLEAEEAAQPPRRAKPAPVSEPQVVTKSDTKAAADAVNQASEHTEAPEAVELPAEARQAAPTSAGMGRGGLDHQHIVEQLAVDAARFGYRASKEFAVPSGRVDIALEKRERRIAIEVAVNSNTAHEIENIQKCLAGGFGHVVSLSPLPNVTENIRRAAQRQLPPEQLARVQFHSPESLLAWLNAVSADDEVAPPVDEVRSFGGRRVRIKHVQLAPDERARLEKEHLAAIAEILSSSSTE